MFVIVLCIFQIRGWLYNNCRDPLSCVIVTGDRIFTTNDDIKNAIMQMEVLGTFITQDVNMIQEKIEQLPWVRHVSIRKQWPDVLKIHIVEHIPVAFWNDDSIISIIGKVFEVPDFKSKNQDRNFHKIWMPILYGPEKKAQNVLDNYLIFRKILQIHAFQIKALKMDMYYSWQLILQNNIYLKLGRENIVERLCYFIKIYPILVQKIHESNQYIDYIDLRYRSGCAIKWIDRSIVSTTNLCNQ